MCPVKLTGERKKRFDKFIRKDRNVLRLHWIKNMKSEDIKIYRFTRAIFSLEESSFLLNVTLREHLETSIKYKQVSELDKTIDEIEESLFVDDIVTGELTVKKLKKIKETEKNFGKAGIELHKWHSNAKKLE